jgi:hypothetical protein
LRSPSANDFAPSSPTRRWLLLDILLPFAITRAALLWLTWWTQQYGRASDYPLPTIAERGWTLLRSPYLDVWARWDVGWYLTIANHGYSPPPAPGAASTVAFFPLYPLAVRAVGALLGTNDDASLLLVALAISNVAAIAGLATLFVLVRDTWADEALARRTIAYVLLFPAGFFLSCAYTESTFLLLTTGAFLAAHRRRFWVAGALAALASVTRATGILLVPSLAWAYLAARRFDLRALRADALALALAPAALLAHGWNVARITGDPFGMIHVQAAWGRSLAWPWETLARKGHHRYVGHFDRFTAIGFTVLAGRLAVIARKARVDWTLYAALSLVPVLTSGVPLSATRLLSVAFPCFVPLAMVGRRERVHLAIIVAFLTAQAALFVSWSRFHWAG